MKNDLQTLYHPLILRHDREPCGFAKRLTATHVLRANNPICGDRFDLFFEVENAQVRQVSFHGYGCAVSKASTSVLVETIENQSVEEVKLLCGEFLRLFGPEGSPGQDGHGAPPVGRSDFLPFAAARHFPGRQQCATLAWETLLDFLQKT